MSRLENVHRKSSGSQYVSTQPVPAEGRLLYPARLVPAASPYVDESTVV